ncbi:MAG: hypothetical protein LBK94_10000 [Prevotellaceae bacterium]|jgi:hypothetical protein|nr:hypothetical protein [Prevotellaceae bacterium]
MKKCLFIIISLFVLTANVNAANKIAFAAEYSLFAEQNNEWYYVKSTRFTRGELSRIGGAMVHLGHQKFFESPATQRAITYLSLITPIGEGVGLIGNLIRTGAKFLAKEGTALARELGVAGERAVGITGSKTAIKVAGRTRIPDALTRTTLIEVKNVKSLSFTSQLRDFSVFSQQTGREFMLYTRPNTILSTPLRQAIDNGLIIRRFIP